MEKQYGGQVHLFRTRSMLFQKFCFPRLNVWKGAQQSQRSGSDIPALRPNHNYVPYVPPKHMAALLETVPETQTVLLG